MSLEPFDSKFAPGRVFWLVIHRTQPASPLVPGSARLVRTQIPASSSTPVSVVDHTPGMNFTMAGERVLRCTVENLSFDLDCGRGVMLVEDPTMRYQITVKIAERSTQEFVVEAHLGTDENDTADAREVMDLICEKVNDIEMRYDEYERESCDSHEEAKILAVHATWANEYEVLTQTAAQKDTVDAWFSHLLQNNQRRNQAFNGWTIPLAGSDTLSRILREGLSSGRIRIVEKGTPAEICDRRERAARARRQLRGE